MSFYSDASLVMIPSGYKNQKVYCAVPTDGSADLTFSRASSATRVASNGLIEKVRTNLLTYSNTFSDAAWTKIAASVTQGATDPFGGSTAWTFQSTAASGQAQISTAITGTNTLSIYAKAGTINTFSLWIGSVVTFNLATGVVTAGTGSMENVGNGWYRCIVPFTSHASFNPYFDTTAIGQNVLIAFAQAETGDIATDYIATTTAAVSVGPVSGLPRLDYLNSSCPRLLLEPQRTNLNPYSQQFDTADWEKTNTTITANATTSPDGYVNADAWFETIDNAQHRLYDNGISVTSGTAYTCSLFVKANGRSWVSIEFFAGGGGFNGNRVWFNISNGTIGTTQTGITAKIDNYGNGWYRIQATKTADATTTGYILYHLATADGVTSYAGDPTKGAFVYGGMTEAGAYATSYIPTLGTSVTRVAEGSLNFSAVVNNASFTFFFEGSYSFADTNFFDLRVLTAAGYHLGYYAGFRAIYDVGSGTQTLGPALSANANHKVLCMYDGANAKFYRDGTLFLTLAATGLGTFVDGFIHNDDQEGFKVKQFLYFPTALTDAQCVELTTL